MVWGAFSFIGKLSLAFPSCRMDSSEYQGVLAGSLLPFLEESPDDIFTFQQDNASVHASKSTKKWLEDHGIMTLPWPACSPDLNPIENVWAIMVREVYKEGRQYSSVGDLKRRVIEVWAELDQGILCNLVRSMPNRLFQVINRNGDVTDY